MSADGDAPAPHEVVIVRRRGGYGDDDHHGGAWKIAFADLMTAMMAFFLVMWLINVSDTEKVQKIATYFNPMKLNAMKPTARGVEEEIDIPKSAKGKSGENEQGGRESEGQEGKLGNIGAKREGGDGTEAEGKAKRAEEELFNDPYGVLARLALQAELADEPAGSGKDDVLLPGGDTFSNPFEPFSQRKAEPERSETIAPPSPLAPEEPAIPNPTDEGINAPPGQAKLAPGQPQAPPGSAAQSPNAAQETVTAPVSPPGQETVSAEPMDAQVRAVAEELKKALQAFPDNKKPSVEVTAEGEGVLISLTDDFNFGMFATSSAEPSPELVVVMEKVAKVLGGRPGELVIRGHTDGRQYKTQKNNNWRLSLSRAQIAYYMLVRGGIAESRISRIEGHADRDLKTPDDPYAAQNRRIEILLRLPKS